jgi:hypothetical protein
MPWVVFDANGNYLFLKAGKEAWTKLGRKARLFGSRDAAESFAINRVKVKQWWVIELALHELDPRIGQRPKASAKIRTAKEIADCYTEREVTKEEIIELPYRIMAARLLFGPDMPEGVKNPYYHRAKSPCDSLEAVRLRRRLVDQLAAKLQNGEAKPPVYDNGKIALPLPRRRDHSSELVGFAIEPRESKYQAAVRRERMYR